MTEEVRTSRWRRRRRPVAVAAAPVEPEPALVEEPMQTLRAFPVIYARDVTALADFYRTLGFDEVSCLRGDDGAVSFIGLARGVAELALATAQSPQVLAGVSSSQGRTHEMFIYVEDIAASVDNAVKAGAEVLRAPDRMPWGELVAYLRDPEQNMVTLAQASSD